MLGLILLLPDLHSRFQRLNGCLPIPSTVQDAKVGWVVHQAHAVLKVLNWWTLLFNSRVAVKPAYVV